MTYKSLTHRFLLLLGIVLSSYGLFGQDLEAGKTIFRNNCAACHAGDMKTNLTGPALGGAPERWADYGGDEALYSWIRNSQAMIAAGDNERATQLWAEWGPTVMNSFLNLSDEDIANTLAYIQGVYDGTYPPKTGGGSELFGGIWILLLSIAALREQLFSKSFNILGIIIGISGIFSDIPGLSFLTLIFGLTQIIWFIWLGILLRKK